MNALHTPETAATPAVELDQSAGSFQIKGRSLSDNPKEFYQPVLEWLRAYGKAPNSETNLIFKFEYLNHESSKSILDILNIMEGIAGSKVTWYFNEEDEDMEEIGEELAELVQVPFEFKHY